MCYYMLHAKLFLCYIITYFYYMIIIGEIIKKVLQQNRFSITEFAKKINTNRNNVYDIFIRKTIDTGLLLKIGDVLDHDFFQYYITDNTKSWIVNEKQNIYTTNSEIKKLNKKISVLKKEIAMMNERLKDKEEIIALIKKSRD